VIALPAERQPAGGGLGLLVVVLRQRQVGVAADYCFDPIISKVAANTLAGSRPRRRRARRRRRVHDIVLVHPARRRPVLNRCARARTASLPGRSRTGRDRRDPRRGDHARRSTERSVAVRGPHRHRDRAARAATRRRRNAAGSGRDRRDRHDRGRAAALRSSRRARLPNRERERPRRPERGRSRQPAARRELRDHTPLHASTARSGFLAGADRLAPDRGGRPVRRRRDRVRCCL